ncbi:hypothetical protein LTR48_000200 [Friedmanniomyces endolithicus]|uniref:Uncharacterized protein n=2 Tax=Dothideomycetidae TaxID=451867 RepID=A0A4U0UJ75_9PEZI|nr:hypothetical protein LTS09_001030 [Friedmanniomyces endolithicus]KAK0943508.1 hypothetical protein LTR29_004885 [Friedmanniomyces endolithicus]KAK1094479.1 hypothetical protein LTR48_000200 [Friedmanniomyces endolithicus]KAK5148622.1 hypothetical protein LTR32_000125 [Rachicladosporium monterosium]TKA35733.1 hypothetical protein B0A54_12902 [Friedmanniomyces endolithicus]
MSGFLRPRNIAIVGGIGAALFLFPRTTAQISPVTNIFETPAVKSVGDRHAAGGASNTHTTGVATKRGDSSNTMSSQINPKGLDSASFQTDIREQKAGSASESSAFPGGEQLHKAVYGEGNAKGK